MNERRCECGHLNPVGTILCEACGNEIAEEKSENSLADMRYEGSARRSQTYNKTIIDKIWNFFSSVKVGVSLIVIALVVSALGTIFPQSGYIPQNIPPSEYYEAEYGAFGNLFYQLGLHELYSSWWYLIIVSMLGMSILIASIDRFFPLYRSLKNQRVTRHDNFMKRQRLYGVTKYEGNLEIAEIKDKLKSKGYRIREENGNLLAEKGRFSRWGPYVNHIGLIIFLIAVLLRSVPGMYVDEVIRLREGETKEIPGTNGQYYLTNNKFIFEVYDKEKDNEAFKEALEKTGGVVKTYQSNVTLLEQENTTLPGESPKLSKVKDFEIKVNVPLKHDHYALYQSDYKLNEFKALSFQLINKETKESFGTVTIDLDKPEKEYVLEDGYKVKLNSYFPDFKFDESGEPSTISKVPNNPAFVFTMITPDNPEGEMSFVAIQETVEPFGENEYKMAFAGVDTRNVTVLTVRKDLTLGLLFVGGTIFMIGIVQGSYWNHRRIWLKRKEQEIVIAGHTNKNWLGLKKDFTYILENVPINEPIDQLEEQKSSSKGESISG